MHPFITVFLRRYGRHPAFVLALCDNDLRGMGHFSSSNTILNWMGGRPVFFLILHPLASEHRKPRYFFLFFFFSFLFSKDLGSRFGFFDNMRSCPRGALDVCKFLLFLLVTLTNWTTCQLFPVLKWIVNLQWFGRRHRILKIQRKHIWKPFRRRKHTLWILIHLVE